MTDFTLKAHYPPGTRVAAYRLADLEPVAPTDAPSAPPADTATAILPGEIMFSGLRPGLYVANAKVGGENVNVLFPVGLPVGGEV